MNEDDESNAWGAFEKAAPNLCYITRARELLANLISKAKDLDDLAHELAHAMPESENISFRADLKILKQKLDDVRRRPTQEG
jgi:hypothetical protein